MTTEYRLGANQTPKECFHELQRVGRQAGTATGTGLFLVPAPEKGPLELDVTIIRNLTYRETAKRGAHCFAWKWLADSIMSYDEIITQRKENPCMTACGNGLACPRQCLCASGTYALVSGTCN